MRNLAVGLLVATGLALAVPAYAEDAYVGVGPVGVDVGVHHDRWRNDYAQDRDVVVHRDHRRHCEVRIVHRYGEERTIRRCW